MDVLRWGRSAYETDAGLALEADKVRALGATWRHEPDPTVLPPAELDVLVVNSGVRVTAEVLHQTQCQLVLTTTSGYDHIELEACRKAKVVAARCPLARRDAVVEHALGAMIWLRRQLSALQHAAEDGRWARSELPNLHPKGLAGATVADIGLGVIGRKMTHVLHSLGATVVVRWTQCVPVDAASFAATMQALSRAGAPVIFCLRGDSFSLAPAGTEGN